MRGSLYPSQIKSSLRKKIVIGFIVFITIPLLFFEIVLFRSWLSITRGIVVHQYETILGDSIQSLRQNLVSIEKMNDTIYRDYQSDNLLLDKLNLLSDNPSPINDSYVNAVFTQLSNQFFSQMKAQIMFTYLSMQGNIIYQRSNQSAQVHVSNFLSSYKEAPWFQQIKANGPINSVFSAHRSYFQEDDPSTYISFGQVIRSPIDLRPLGVSLITVNTSLFDQLLKSPSDNKLIKTVVTDAQETLIYTNDHTERFPVDASHIFKQTIQPYNWEVRAYLSSERLSRSYIVPLIQNNGLFVIANILMLAAIIGFVTRQLKPLYILADKMEKAKEGHFHVKIGKYSTDELGMLCDIFNDMTTEIQRLFENQKKEYQEKLYFQMKSLESQINPHFIYNMLDLIQCRVYEGDPDKSSDLIVALSVILRYTTTRPGEKVTCAEELKWLRDYIFLQSQLIGMRVDVQIEFEDQIMSFKVSKLILQPIIENAFIHGFEQINPNAKLLIKVYADAGRLCFEVRDNGQGFPGPIDLHLTRDNVDELKDWGTGLYVTAQRFLLQSHNGTIHLNSVPSKGTYVIMKQDYVTQQICTSDMLIP
ncbi:sensor histidine kinase [Paenibacillus sp. LjRoot56]|uniref:sensor histidine kinase n=1 Tax=Paenibacillus sp. LjRoot56 TaxID=3342333 RepID=UPI003ECEB253